MPEPTVRHVQGSSSLVIVTFAGNIAASWAFTRESGSCRLVLFMLMRTSFSRAAMPLAEVTFTDRDYTVGHLNGLQLPEALTYWKAGRAFLDQAKPDYPVLAHLLTQGDPQLALLG